MITGFEEITAELNAEENILLPIIAAGLKKNVGKRNAAKSEHIIKVMFLYGYTLKDARLRKIINVIRRTGYLPNLVASSKGYYVAETAEDAERFIKSLNEREEAIRAVRLAMEKQKSNL